MTWLADGSVTNCGDGLGLLGFWGFLAVLVWVIFHD